MNDDSIILPPLPEYAGVYRNLVCVGLLGSLYCAGQDVDAVCTVVETTLADSTGFRMWRAIISGLGGHGEFAKAELGRHLEAFPDDEVAKVSLATALMLSGDPAWRPLIDNVLATSIDPVARRAASGVVQFLEGRRN